MNLEFETLTVENFRCFSRKQTFKLAPSPGLWFLRGKNEVEPSLGSNGSGKSSLFEALCWLLTGRTSKGLRNPDIKPWTGKGTPSVELKLLIDEKPKTISRTATTKGLQIDGKEVGPEEATKLLGLPLEILLNTHLFAQGQPLFFDRTAKEKLQLFTEVWRLELWEDRSKRASDKVRELERLESEIEGELTGATSALEQTSALLSRTKTSSEEWAEQTAQRREGVAAEIALLEKQVVKAEGELGEIRIAHDAAGLKLREMREDVKKLQADFAATQNALNTEENRIVMYERDLKRLERELAELGEADECPVCRQPVKGTQLGAHKKELSTEAARVRKLVDQGVSVRVQRENDTAYEALSAFNKELGIVVEEADELQTQLNLAAPNTERIRTKLLGLKVGLQERDREENPYVEQLQVLRKQKAKQETAITELEEDLQKAKRQIERTKFWIKGFKDVSLFLIEEALQELEAVTNSLLGEVGLVGWLITYDVERETKSGTVQRGINVLISSPANTQAVKWESWSGGESQRLRLVGAVALSEVLLRHAGVSSNLEIFDEPTQHLSPSGVSDLCAYLAARAKANGKTVWLIDHSAREGATFSGTVTVTKTEKGSVLS